MLFGFLLSATVFGAVCGIPMILIGLPLSIFGGIRYRKYQLEALKNSIREGIVEGFQQRAQPARSCPSCGHQNPDGTKFCSSCGTAMS